MIVYPPPYDCLIWDYRRTNTDTIINSINQVDLGFLFCQKNVYQLVKMFSQILFQINVTFTDMDPPWMTNYSKYKIHCKNSFYHKYLKHGKKN